MEEPYSPLYIQRENYKMERLYREELYENYWITIYIVVSY